jgi:RNA polymerase sigma-70 factor (ECF subfamily)
MTSEPRERVKEPPGKIGDEELIAAYNRGRLKALDELVERYRKPLFNFLMRMTKCEAEAEEIFQNTWMRVITKAHGFQGDHFKSWLFKIGHNLVIDWSRREKKQISMDAPLGGGENEATLGDRIKTPEPGPDIRANSLDLGKAIELALAQLPAEQREVFTLRMEADMAFKDIAKLQRVSLNTALSRMHYALAKMRMLLKEHEPDRKK